jgi:hypothetical protein
MIKVKFYELLQTLITLDNEIINKAIEERRFCDILMVRNQLIFIQIINLISFVG